MKRACLALLIISCGTAQEEVRYPIHAVGTTDNSFPVGDWMITLERASLGFGPAYFCTTEATTADLCGTPLAEFASVAVVDALEPTPQPLGEVRGYTGEIRSVQLDYALPWLKTQPRPMASSAAPEGHSLVVAGVAQRGDVSFRFTLQADIVSNRQGERAVQSMRTDGVVSPWTSGVTVQVAPSSWLAGVDFNEVAALDGDTKDIPVGSRAHNAVIFALTNTARPTFTWTVKNEDQP